MTQDLISVRNLVDSDFDLPVKSFDGTYGGHESKAAGNFGGSITTLNYSDVDNIVSVMPYNFPTVAISIWDSNKKKSQWGYFGTSLVDYLGPDEDLKDCVGRRMSLVFCDGQGGRPEMKPIYRRDADVEKFPDKMVPQAVWVVTAVEGSSAGPTGEAASGVSAAEWAEQNLIGKTRADFNKWAFADPQVRKDTQLQRSITDKSFINSLLQLGRVTEDGDGVFTAAQ